MLLYQVGEEIIIQGLVSHGEEFGFYPVYIEDLRLFKQRSDYNLYII